MQRLLEIQFGQYQLVLQGSSWTGYEELLVDGSVVSSTRTLGTNSAHSFVLPDVGSCQLSFHIDGAQNRVVWLLSKDGETLADGEAPFRIDLPAPQPQVALDAKPQNHFIAIAGIFFKLFKSGGVIKVALAGTAFASWSLIFNWQFALMLLGVIVFHEYGHIRAMKKFGIPTKGIYLIPFFGGVAVGDKASTYWQEVYISMMGPVFGLYMSLAFWAAFLVTGIPTLGMVATFSALVNLFNLLPVYPLDGGHVLKAITLSANPKYSWIVLLTISATGFALTMALGLYFISFFFVLGAVDLIGARASMRDANVVPMKPYAILVSTAWLVSVVGIFIFLIYHTAISGVSGMDIPWMILQE